MKAVVYDCVSPTLPFTQTALIINAHCNRWIVGLVQSLCFLPHCQHWSHTRTPLKYPVVGLCPGDPASLVLHGWANSTLKLGLHDSWVGQAACSPLPVPPAPRLQLCPGEGRAQLSHAWLMPLVSTHLLSHIHATRASSSVLPWQGVGPNPLSIAAD